ncbi:hypothetical protein LINPERHAP2_LOCUS29729 [Linum perenne]
MDKSREWGKSIFTNLSNNTLFQPSGLLPCLTVFSFYFIFVDGWPIRYAIVEEFAKLGATVHTCSRTEEELNQRLTEWG